MPRASADSKTAADVAAGRLVRQKRGRQRAHVHVCALRGTLRRWRRCWRRPRLCPAWWRWASRGPRRSRSRRPLTCSPVRAARVPSAPGGGEEMGRCLTCSPVRVAVTPSAPGVVGRWAGRRAFDLLTGARVPPASCRARGHCQERSGPAKRGGDARQVTTALCTSCACVCGVPSAGEHSVETWLQDLGLPESIVQMATDK